MDEIMVEVNILTNSISVIGSDFGANKEKTKSIHSHITLKIYIIF